MTTSVNQADEDAAAARADVARAENDLASGHSRVTASKLHALRDRWRHADLTAQGARQRAEQDRAAARLAGLEQIGEEVDNLVTSDETAALTEVLREAAAACTRFRDLAAAHDAAVMELVAAATDLKAEPAAPNGPRATSAHVTVSGQSIIHKRTRVSMLGDCAALLAKAVEGDLDAAIAAIRVVALVHQPKRPDYLIRGRNGIVQPLTGPLGDAMAEQVRLGNVTMLPDTDIDRYMEGTLG